MIFSGLDSFTGNVHKKHNNKITIFKVKFVLQSGILDGPFKYHT